MLVKYCLRVLDNLVYYFLWQVHGLVSHYPTSCNKLIRTAACWLPCYFGSNSIIFLQKSNSHHTHISWASTCPSFSPHCLSGPRSLHWTFRCTVACTPKSVVYTGCYSTSQELFRTLRKIQVIPSQLWKAEQSLGALASSCYRFSVQELKWQVLDQKIGD